MNPTRRSATRGPAPVVLLSFLLGVLVAPGATATSRPNIVVILADDQGWGDLGFNGNTSVTTPQIDALARAGARLDHFYVSPVCSPTRAEFLTGRYHLRSGVHDTGSGGERLNLDEHTIAETFKAAGYATGLLANGTTAASIPTTRMPAASTNSMASPRGTGHDISTPRPNTTAGASAAGVFSPTT